MRRKLYDDDDVIRFLNSESQPELALLGITDRTVMIMNSGKVNTKKNSIQIAKNKRNDID